MNISVSYSEYRRNVKLQKKVLDKLGMDSSWVKPMDKKTFEEFKQ